MNNCKPEVKQSYEAIIQTIENNGWDYFSKPEDYFVNISFNYNDKLIDINFILDPNEGDFFLQSFLSAIISPDKIVESVIILNELNSNLSVGGMDLDLKDGNLFFKIYCNLLICPLTVEIVEIYINLAIELVDRFDDPFMRFNNGDMLLEDMIELVYQ